MPTNLLDDGDPISSLNRPDVQLIIFFIYYKYIKLVNWQNDMYIKLKVFVAQLDRAHVF